jgi:hypothetical protein
MPATILINSTDRAVPQFAGRHMRGQVVGETAYNQPFTGSGEADIAAFYQFTITDKQPNEVDQKLFAVYNRDIDFTLINANQTLRRYEANNLNASPAGLGHWTTDVVAQIKANWEVDHPLADITTIGFPNQGVNGLGSIWDFSGVFQPGEGEDFKLVVHEAGLGAMDYRTIWRITEAGMINIGNAGGLQSGTASQLNGILVDERTL